MSRASLALHPCVHDNGDIMTEPDSPGDHSHTAEEERVIREAALDRTIEASFPASDPPSTDPNPDDHDAFDRSHPLPTDKQSNP